MDVYVLKDTVILGEFVVLIFRGIENGTLLFALSQLPIAAKAFQGKLAITQVDQKKNASQHEK